MKKFVIVAFLLGSGCAIPDRKYAHQVYPESRQFRVCEYEAEKATAGLGRVGDFNANMQWSDTREKLIHQCMALSK